MDCHPWQMKQSPELSEIFSLANNTKKNTFYVELLVNISLAQILKFLKSNIRFLILIKYGNIAISSQQIVHNRCVNEINMEHIWKKGMGWGLGRGCINTRFTDKKKCHTNLYTMFTKINDFQYN